MNAHGEVFPDKIVKLFEPYAGKNKRVLEDYKHKAAACAKQGYSIELSSKPIADLQ